MKELMEKVIPWNQQLAATGNAPAKAATLRGRRYSSFQIALIDSFSKWIRLSYIPVGGVPQAERLVLPDPRAENEYLPSGTGVSMAMWAPCYDRTGQKIIKAQPASASRITILTNHLKGVIPAHDYNTSNEYYFTMYYNTTGKLVHPEDAMNDEPTIQEIRSRIGYYMVYPTGRLVNVLLMPEKELPIVQVTKREVMKKGEEAVRRIYPDPSAHVRLEVEKNIQKLYAKHAGSLDAPAAVYQSQLGILAFSGPYDPFEPMTNTRFMFPVYKYKAEAYELSKRDQPHWVHISFPYATEKSSTTDREIYKAMMTNFNYDYVYQYFFEPDKIRGRSYQPRRMATQSGAEAAFNEREQMSSPLSAGPGQQFHF